MSAKSNLLIYGGGAFSNVQAFKDAETDDDYSKVFKALKDAGVDKIDVAQLYGNGHAEEMIGKFKALDQGFGIDTKWIGGWKGKAWASEENIVTSTQESYKLLGSSKDKQVDIFYIHSPDIWTPFEETLKGVQKAYEDGGFKRFGLSNFTPDQVREVLRICKEKNYVKPTVFQGSYAAVARGIEDETLPLLRENGIALYAYSPIAGGFLTKNRKFIEEEQGRFNSKTAMPIYHKMYKSDSLLSILDDWEKIANDEGVSKAELAYRWINYHSALKPELGDGVIFGASSLSQIEGTVGFLRKGPLSQKAADAINALWDHVKKDAIIDNFQALYGGSS